MERLIERVLRKFRSDGSFPLNKSHYPQVWRPDVRAQALWAADVPVASAEWFAWASSKKKVSLPGIAAVDARTMVEIWQWTTVALMQWTPHKAVYEVDPDFARLLDEVEVPTSIPVTELVVPFPGLVVELPTSSGTTTVVVSKDLIRGETSDTPPQSALRFGVVFSVGELDFICGASTLILRDGLSIAEAAEEWDKPRSHRNDDASLSIPESRSLLNLLLYLSSSHDVVRVIEPQPRRRAARWMDADRPRVYQVGNHVGRLVRRHRSNDQNQAPSSDPGRTVRPHLRRAHFHTYWVKNPDGEKVRRVKLVSHIFVKGTTVGLDDPAVVRRVG